MLTMQCEITQIANHGILIRSGSQCIASDAVEDGTEYYEKTPEDFYQRLKEQKEAGKLSAFLVTHSHADHFSSPKLKEILRAGNERGGGCCVNMVVDSLSARQMGDEFRDEVIALEDKKFGSQTVRLDGLSITAFPCPHLSREQYPLYNFSYLIQIGDFNIFVGGDSDLYELDASCCRGKLADIDAAVLCYTYIFTRRNISLVNELIHPERLLVNHFPREDCDRYDTYSRVRKFYEKNKSLLPPTVFLKNYGDSCLLTKGEADNEKRYFSS